MHAQMQEAHSMRQLELAKSTNIDKLVSEFLYFNQYLFVIFFLVEVRVAGGGGGGGGVEVELREGKRVREGLGVAVGVRK